MGERLGSGSIGISDMMFIAIFSYIVPESYFFFVTLSSIFFKRLFKRAYPRVMIKGTRMTNAINPHVTPSSRMLILNILHDLDSFSYTRFTYYPNLLIDFLGPFLKVRQFFFWHT